MLRRQLSLRCCPLRGVPGLERRHMLPPLMFSEEEIEALVLGSRWVADRTDSRLAEAARNALSKIEAVLPIDLRIAMNDSTLLVGPKADTDADDSATGSLGAGGF